MTLTDARRRAWVLPVLLLLTLATPASAHTTAPTSLTIIGHTEASIALDWTQDYVHGYDGYFVRINGGTRTKYRASRGTIDRGSAGAGAQICVSIDLTTSDHPDESDEACITAATGNTTSPSCYFGPFGIDNWPPACWRPYADTSPFNQVIPANPKLVSNSSAIVARLLGFGAIQHMTAGQEGTSLEYTSPFYYPTDSDPLFRIHCVRYSCPELEGTDIRVPARARPAAGGDGHLTTLHDGVEYDLFEVQNPGQPVGNGGVLNVSSGGKTSITGSGVDLTSSSTAAHWGRMGGIIRARELQSGAINHALYMVIRCSAGYSVEPAWPTATAASCSSSGRSNTDAPPLGSRFQLNMTDGEITMLRVPEWKKTILRAMAKYGMLFSDTGSGSWAIQAESDTSFTSFGRAGELMQFAKSAPGVVAYNGEYVFNLNADVPWNRMRVIAPCAMKGEC